MSKILSPRLRLIDGIAFLHSSFTKSPVIRFPLIGKAINRELGFFKPETNNFISDKAKKSLFKSINFFGKKLLEEVVDDTIAKYISIRNGQVFTISDLPIEWLSIDGVPLSFTHDVCRMPEAEVKSLVHNYSHNNRISYSIENSILKETLVIFGATSTHERDKPFQETYNFIKEMSNKLGFNLAYCMSIQDVISAIKKIKPKILIFDCHGGVDEKNKENYLLINNEKLFGETIIEEGIFAPIVFLSACTTAPNYGYLHQISNTFFYAGALSVTGTFLPISVARGATIYIRILSKLKFAVEQPIPVHKNWLEFISHIIRSSIFYDVFRLANGKLSIEENKELLQLLQKILDFKNRRKIFLDLVDNGIKFSKKLKLKIENTNSEFLLYTHLGRPDLIYFKNWLDFHQKFNIPNQDKTKIKDS